MTAPPRDEAGTVASSRAEGISRTVTIGILALQGAFAEHAALLRKVGADVREVRLPDEVDGLDGIVLPGGESTAMALIGERWGVFPRLKQWVMDGRPVWGTCAGMILLSDHALMTKQGGQSLVGGLNMEICRNYFGAQKSSFEVPLNTSKLGLRDAGKSFDGKASNDVYPAVFIRAPAVLEVGPDVQVLCRVRAWPCNKAVAVMSAQLKTQEAKEMEPGSAAGNEGTPAAKRQRLASFFTRSESSTGSSEEEAPEVIVAVRKGNIIGTAFHPELTNDARWHEYFVKLVEEVVRSRGAAEAAPVAPPLPTAGAATVVA